MIIYSLIGIDDFQAIIVSAVEYGDRVGESILRADDGRAFRDNKVTHPRKRPGRTVAASNEKTGRVKLGRCFPIDQDFRLPRQVSCREAD